MFNNYKVSINIPEIKVGPNSFLVIIPKYMTNHLYDNILTYIQNNGECTREEIDTLLNSKKRNYHYSFK